jgi:hypothetical protein
VKDAERARVNRALAAVELNMVECQEVDGWWLELGPDVRRRWREFQVEVRAYQRAVQKSR